MPSSAPAEAESARTAALTAAKSNLIISSETCLKIKQAETRLSDKSCRLRQTAFRKSGHRFSV
jgi:hypothetical protein